MMRAGMSRNHIILWNLQRRRRSSSMNANVTSTMGSRPGGGKENLNFPYSNDTQKESCHVLSVDIIPPTHIPGERYASWAFQHFPPFELISRPDRVQSSQNVSIISLATLLCRRHCAGVDIHFATTFLTVDDDFIFIHTILKFIFHMYTFYSYMWSSKKRRKFRTINSWVELR